jgi:hypothetical protein
MLFLCDVRPAFEDEDDVIGGRGDDRDEDEEEVPFLC